MGWRCGIVEGKKGGNERKERDRFRGRNGKKEGVMIEV